MGWLFTQPREEEGTRLAALLDTEDPALLGHPLTSAKVTVGLIIDPAQRGGGSRLAALLDTEDPALLGHPLTSAKVTMGR